MRRPRLFLILPALAFASFASAQATDLQPGQTLGSVPQTYTLPSTALESRTDFLSGIDQSINLLTYEAEIRSAVYRNADGTLSFAYSLYSFYAGSTDIARLSISGLADYTTAVEQEAARPNDGVFASGGATRTASGSEISFLFQGNGEPGTQAIAPDETSVFQIIRTNATEYTFGTVSSVGENGVAASSIAFVPTGAPVPEPATMAALGLGVAAFARRRRAKA